MNAQINLLWLLGTMGIPSAFTVLCFWLLQRQLSRKQDEISQRETARIKNEVILVKSVRAAISLSEATALALKNGTVNGETEKALKYAKMVKAEQKEFLVEQGIKNIY